MLVTLSALAIGGAGAARAQEPYRDLVCSYNWPCERAMMIMKCESKGDPTAYAANNYGLFQLNSIHAGRFVGGEPTGFFDPDANVAAAYQLYTEQGFAPWKGCGG